MQVLTASGWGHLPDMCTRDASALASDRVIAPYIAAADRRTRLGVL